MSFWTRLFTREAGSKDTAKERLRLVLVQDRSNVSPQLMQAIKEDLIKVISKYIDIDESGIEVKLTTEDNAVALDASIPVRKIKRYAG